MATAGSLSLQGPVRSICPECGQPIGPDQCCWVCVARYEDIEQTVTVAVIVGFGGMIATVFTVYSYIPLGSCWWAAFTIAGLFFVPAVITYTLYNIDLAARYVTFVRVMLAVAAGAIVMLSAFFFLNGFLDVNPPVEVPALVLQKFIESGRNGEAHYLQLNLSWNGEKFDADDLLAGRKTYSLTEPGDYVRVIVHPGKFSLPWYSGVLPPLVSHESNPR